MQRSSDNPAERRPEGPTEWPVEGTFRQSERAVRMESRPSATGGDAAGSRAGPRDFASPVRRDTAVLLLLCSAQFVAVLDANALLVALPLVGRDLDLHAGALQWVITGYVIVYAGCLLAA